MQRLFPDGLSGPWAIFPPRLRGLPELAHQMEFDGTAYSQIPRHTADAQLSRRDMTRNGAIAVLSFCGIVMQRAGAYDAVFGVLGLQQFVRAFHAALVDDSVGGILIDIDSPGGSVNGVAEFADQVYQARRCKPILAIANSLAASAAYWIGSAASQFYITPSGEVGSIGVQCIHEDCSKALDKAGVRTTLISAGRYKTEQSASAPLGNAAKMHIQSRVDAHHRAFTRDVAKHRGVDISCVLHGMGQGRLLDAERAQGENMVDGVATFDEVKDKLSRRIKPRNASLGKPRC
ncbi:signal peptide peptidase SppA [Paraburkholderia sp. GAS41]|uniref:S49 family peptidase n=1 Tax=Paraburkholderia sp. GAS41 TaxID=3035134 RepID=UPI003D25EB0C